jgi:hypothetical protein
MRRWNVIAMGQVGVAGVVTAKVASPIANSISRRTGRSEDQILAIIGAGILVISLIYFLRTVDAVITAGRRASPSQDAPIR